MSSDEREELRRLRRELRVVTEEREILRKAAVRAGLRPHRRLPPGWNPVPSQEASTWTGPLEPFSEDFGRSFELWEHAQRSHAERTSRRVQHVEFITSAM